MRWLSAAETKLKPTAAGDVAVGPGVPGEVHKEKVVEGSCRHCCTGGSSSKTYLTAFSQPFGLGHHFTSGFKLMKDRMSMRS